MVRIIGILCGSAVAISFLIIALGVPEFLPEVEEKTAVVRQPVPVTETTPTPDPQSMPEAMVDAASDVAQEPVEQEIPGTAVVEQAAPQQVTEHWYAFWSPFRSELAANGFVSQLQRTTGMDYRVVRLKPGVYEVAFAYEAEADIETKLAAISAATGLEMPDG